MATFPVAAQVVQVSEPVHGGLVRDAEVSLRGEVEGVVRLQVNGVEIPIEGGRFDAGPYELSEGGRAFLIRAEGPDGKVRELVHRVVRDSRKPRLRLIRPQSGASVRQTSIELLGAAVDRHLHTVWVDGNEVAVEGGRFRHPLQLADGRQDIELRAVDAAGNETVEVLEIVVDRSSPELWLTEATSEAVLEEGAIYGREVWLNAGASEGELELTVDGQPWDPAQPIVEEGSHTVEMVSVDAAGNEARRKVSFSIDRSAPRFESVASARAEVASRHLTLEGQVEGAETVEAGGRQVAVDDTGRFRVPVTLEEGAQSVAVVARDGVGNRSSTSVIVKSDTVDPVVTITSPVAGAVIGSSPIAVSGTAVDTDLVEVRLGAEVATLAGDSFSFAAVSLAEGSNGLTVEAEDGAGNIGSASVTVELDTIAPTLAANVDGAALVDGAVFAGSITPEIVATDATAVTVGATLDGAPYVSGTTIETPGAHSLAVTATDAAGNAAVPLLLGFQTHQSPPSLVTITPADDFQTASSTVTLSGQWDGASELTVAGQVVTLLADGQFITEPLVLAEGANTLTLVATAANGLTSTHQHHIERDSTPPVLTLSSPADGSLVGAAAVDVSGTAADAHPFEVVVNGVASSLSGSTFLARQVPLAEGENVLLVRAEDELGNVREISRTVHSDTAPPVLAFTHPAVSGVVVPGPTLRVEGTAVDAHFDRVAVNGETATDGAGDTWFVDLSIPEGESTLTAEAFDTLGNRSQATLTIERDSAAPEVSINEPLEGWATTAATVDVRGTVADEPGVSVTVNGLAATVSGGAFEALAVSLVDGDNLLIARATDPQGNEGVDSRAVTRDNEAPSFTASDPIAGALALGANTVFEATFSELLAEPQAGAYRLEADDGAGGWNVLATAAVLDGANLRITPSSLLPTQTNLRLVLTGQLVDPAGNPLSNPTTLEVSTADTAAPTAPQVVAPPPFLCASAVTVAGTSEADVRVTVSGGAAPVTGQASAGGNFSLSVELLPGLNALSVVATDGGGNASSASLVDVVQDCEPPRVIDATRVGDVFHVTFDEPVQPATVPAAVSLSTTSGAVPGAVSASAATATFTPSGALPPGDLLLEVASPVADLAGNILAYPYSRWFEEDPGESFFSGTAIDDATGRPLVGVNVTVTATDGIATGLPRPELTTDEAGRFVLAVPAGTHDVTFARPGYSPVFRLVTTVAGSGAEVFDPRLTPVDAVESLAASGGVVAASNGADLTVPSGVLTAATDVSLTPVSGQGLAALLPYGWSPRAAAWVDIESDPVLASAATLQLPVASPDGVSLTVAELDLGTLQWRALATQTVTAGVVTAAVTTTGAYAALERDAGMAEPLPGDVLVSLPAPSSDVVVAAAMSFDPELVLPNQRSQVTVSYTTSVAVASGVPLTLEIQEQLELLDGSQRNEAPYRADLVLYRDLAGASVSTFWLQPSAAARSLPVSVGSEVVVVETYADEGVRGNVLGPNGGTVVGDQGDSFEVPTGALPEPTAVVIHRRQLGDLPLTTPRGVSIDGVIELELELPLTLPGTLSYALTPPPTGELGVLLAVVEIDGEPHWRAVAAIEPTAAGWITSSSDGLPWPGVTEAGLYAFARYTEPHGAAWGVMTAVGGSPVAGGVVSSPAVDWLQLSDAQGRYVLPLPADGQSVTLRAENPATGNVREDVVTVTSAGEQIELGLPLQIVAPNVVGMTPVDGATGVPLGVEPTVDFNEPVDPSTLAAGLQLLRDGEPQAIQFVVQGTLVRILPAAPLLPETDYTVAVDLAIQDLQGYSLVSQHTATFQTATIELPDSIDPRRLRVIRPDPSTGLATVEGLAGAVPAEVAVVVENTSRPIGTVSATAGQDGSFTLDIEAELGDRLQMTVLIEGGTAPVFWLPPFLSTDLLSAYVGSRAESFTTGDGITVTLEADTFDEPTWVRIASEAITAAPLPSPALLPAVSAFELDFGGATANHRLQLRLPAPANPGAGPYLLNRYVDVLGQQGWMMHDLLDLEDGFFVTSTPSTAQPQPATAASRFPGGTQQGFSLNKSGSVQPRDYVTGVVAAGLYQVARSDLPLSFLVFPAANLSEILVSISSFGDGGSIIGLVNEFLRAFMPHGLIMPTLFNTDFEMAIADLTTGYELFRGTLPASPEPLLELPPDLYGDDQPPVLIGGSPLGLYHLQTAGEGSTQLTPGLTIDVSGNTLSAVGQPGATSAGGKIRLLGLDTDTLDSWVAQNDGSFVLDLEVVRGNRYLMAVETEIYADDEIVLEFNEALTASVTGIEVRNITTGSSVDPIITPRGIRATQVIAPVHGWAVGKYQLTLTPDLTDPNGNSWPTFFEIPFTVVGSLVGPGLSLGSVQDVATLGSLLFVATLEDGLKVVDASRPGDLRNYLPGQLSFEFPFQEATRGVAVDPHGRVYVAGGGAATFGQLKIIDPQAIDPLTMVDAGSLAAAWRGSTLLSDPVSPGGSNTVLSAGFPRRLEILSNDNSLVWRPGVDPTPDAVTRVFVTPPAEPEYLMTLTYEGTEPERAGLPITLRNRTRGTWHRVDADAAGGASFQVVVEQGSTGALAGDLHMRPGDELELLRNRNTFVYVAIDGVGLAVVDGNAFYGELAIQDYDDANIAAEILRYDSGYSGGLAVCDPAVAVVDRTPLDLGVLWDVGNAHPLTIPTLIHRYGLGLLEAPAPSSPMDLADLSEHCAALEDTAVMGGMAVLQAYATDLDGDGILAEDEVRDYIVVTNASVGSEQPTGWVMVFDVSDREHPELVGKIEMPSPVSTVGVDRLHRRLIVGGLGNGLYVVDFDRPPSRDPIDRDGNGRDDRIVEHIPIGNESITELALAPELGLVFAGGQQQIRTIAVKPPQLTMLSAESNDRRALRRVAPLGVPSTGDDDEVPLPGVVRIEARLPGGLANPAGVLRLDVVSEGPGGLEIDGAGDPDQIENLPPTSYRGDNGVLLRRLSQRPYEEAYNVFQSGPLVLVADLRASANYDLQPDEGQLCVRCGLSSSSLQELLSGTRLAVRFPQSFRTAAGEVYSAAALDQAELTVESVPWDIGFSRFPEPLQSASSGSGDVVPGTLVYSGEFSTAATDLRLRGRGFDFAFTRTYRSQLVGGGPLGPGWDHVYRMRLRPLPNGDVELFDGRGRREVFAANTDGDGYILPPGRFASLHRHSAGWNLVDPQDNYYRFDRFGRLASISDAVKTNGQLGTVLELSYNLHSRLERVEAHGRWIHFNYDDAGRLIRINDFSGRDFEYRYDAAGRLIEAQTPPVETFEAPDVVETVPLVTRYGYQDAALDICTERCLDERLHRRNNLESMTDPKGQAWLGMTYGDAAGDAREEEVITQTWGGESVEIDYMSRHPTQRTVTDRRGHQRIYDFNSLGQPVLVEDPLGARTTWTYNDQHTLEEMELPSNRRFLYLNDVDHSDERFHANVREVTEMPSPTPPGGPTEPLVTTIEYGAANQPKTTTDAEGQITSVELTDTGLPIKVSKGGIDLQREFNEFGQVTALINGNGHRTEYEYFDESPRQGLLKKVVVEPQGLALTTSYKYDDRGNQIEITNPRGVRHQFVYNALDWLIEEKWAVLTTSGDLEPIGHRVRYKYDRNGNVTQVERLFGESSDTWTRTQTDYGVLNEVLETRQEVTPGAADWVVERFDYDENFNLIWQQGPDGQVTRLTYDERNTLAARERELAPGDPANLEESFVYNALGQLESRIDANGGSWEVLYDGFDRPQAWINPLGHRTEIEYNKLGHPLVTKAFDADGVLMSQRDVAYDGLQRPHSETDWLWEYEALEPGEDPDPDPPSGAVAVTRQTTYDDASNVVAITDPLNRITRFEFDDAERMIRIEDAAGNITAVDLDASGNAWRQTTTEQAPSGAVTVVTTAAFDALDRQTSATDALDQTTTSSYDRRGNVIRRTDAEGHFTSIAYDGLDRPIRETRPGGIEVTTTYDASSRPVAYRDALGNQTTWAYDVFDRQTSVTYADGTSESYVYDANGNQIEVTQATGSVVTQEFDAADRLTVRQITLGSGVVGPTSETYSYDALDRPVSAQSGVLIERTYDSLSRPLTETSEARMLQFGYDVNSSLVQLTYPSGRQLELTPDTLNRTQSIGWGGVTPQTKATYGYRGVGLLAQREVGAALAGAFDYDPARRLEHQRYQASDGATVFGERTAWTERGLKASQSRTDLNNKALRFGYDGAGRVLDAQHTVDLDSVEPLGAVAEIPGRFAFTYDVAQNLTSKATELACEAATLDLSLDGSKRNRPGEIGGEPLTWNAGGNLETKDGLTFLYDYRDRLTRVEDGGTLLASYTYDALNRRVGRTVSGVLEETVWSGWQSIETYRDGQLSSRRTYGLGIDEIVSFEHDLDLDGILDDEYVPFYDNTGNLALVTDVDGRPIERYTYSPFGEQWIQVDSTPPSIEQVRIEGEAIWVEMSEEIRLEELEAAVTSGDLELTNVTLVETVDIKVTQPVKSGRQAGRRFVIEPTDEATWPLVDQQVELVIAGSAFQDFFGNVATTGFPAQTFDWPAVDSILEDTVAPRLDDVCVESGGILMLQFSEPVDLAIAAAEILVDDQPMTWIVGADGYTLRSEQGLGEGSHNLALDANVVDLAGLGLAAPFDQTLEVDSDKPEQRVFSAPYEGFIDSSSIGNVYGFHGLPRDAETGLLYVRNRYYDPEMGRFISTDPFGYVDGPSMYQFALNDPANLSDPTGEVVETYWDALSLTIGVTSLTHNLLEGNYGLAAFDAFGVVLDSLAVVTPFVPGGAGAALKASRAGGSLAKAHLVDQTLNVSQGIVQAAHEVKQGNYGMGALYGGLSVLGVRQVEVNPFQFRTVGLGANGGNVRIVRKGGGSSRNGGSGSVGRGPSERPLGLASVVDDLPPGVRFDNPRSIDELGPVHSTDSMSKGRWKKHLQSVKDSGIQNPEILYVELGQGNFVVWGSNRLEAARVTGQLDKLKLHKVELPFRGYKTAMDVVEGARDARRNFTSYSRYRR